MTRETPDDLVSHAKELVLSGATVKDAAATIGINADTLSKKLRAQGVVIPRHVPHGHNRREDLDQQAIVNDYLAGHGMPHLAKKFKASTACVRQIIIDSGTPLRGHQVANEIVAKNKTKEQHHSGVAKARQVRLRNLQNLTPGNPAIGKGEQEVYDLLRRSDFGATRQREVDGYIIDIAIKKVAVEIKCKAGQLVTNGASERTMHLSKRGWLVVFVMFNDLAQLTSHASDLVAVLDAACAHPPALGEYWVVRSSRKQVTGSKLNVDEFSVVRYTPQLLDAGE